MRETAGETGRGMRSSCNNTDSQSGYAIFFMFSLSGCCLTTLSPDKDDWRDPPPLPMPGLGATRVRAEAEFVFLFETSHVNQALAIGTTNGIDVGYYVYFSYSVKTTQHVHLCSPRVLSGN